MTARIIYENPKRKAKPKHCLNCDCIFTPIKYVKSRHKMISYNAGKLCSAYCANQWIRNNPERKAKISKAFAGANHPNWQGGKSLLNNYSNRGSNWQRQRKIALEANGHICNRCGISEVDCKEKYNRSLDVDHIIPYHNFNNYKEANKLSNLQLLCASCHRKIESTRSMVQMLLPLQDSITRQHKGYARGEKINTCKLKTYQVIEIIKNKELMKLSELANKYHVTKSAICAILKGKSWKHIPRT